MQQEQQDAVDEDPADGKRAPAVAGLSANDRALLLPEAKDEDGERERVLKVRVPASTNACMTVRALSRSTRTYIKPLPLLHPLHMF